MYEEAETMNQRALGGRRQELEETNPDTLNNLSNLATFHWLQGNYSAAEKVSRQVLTGREKVLEKTTLIYWLLSICCSRTDIPRKCHRRIRFKIKIVSWLVSKDADIPMRNSRQNINKLYVATSGAY
jgi:hypothetical protein